MTKIEKCTMLISIEWRWKLKGKYILSNQAIPLINLSTQTNRRRITQNEICQSLTKAQRGLLAYKMQISYKMVYLLAPEPRHPLFSFYPHPAHYIFFLSPSKCIFSIRFLFIFSIFSRFVACIFITCQNTIKFMASWQYF